MSKIYSASINLDKITESKIIHGKSGRYIDISIACNDQYDKYGNNLSVIESQTNEERQIEQEKNYLGNGRLVWTNEQ